MTAPSLTSQALPRAFPPTRWSVVLAARRAPSPESDAALETLCRAYWYPLYGYVRGRGHSPPDAQDLTQEFFRRLLEKRWLETADREKGRLRTFLIVALKKFLVSEWRRASSRRRGGGHLHVPMDTAFAEERCAVDLQSGLPPDEAFDRQWAITLHDLTLERLQNEFAAAGKAGEFAALKECLMAARGELDYPSLAARLNAGEGAARVAVHRLRKRFRQIYREELSQTLSEGADVEEELRHLARALARS
jgi:DNA-directed RNA polymerase specialized sigma24 family protein